MEELPQERMHHGHRESKPAARFIAMLDVGGAG
jgi:hypothetical protein